MGNTHIKPHPRTKNKKQVHWKAAERPSPPGRPYLAPDNDLTPDLLKIRWSKPVRDGGSPINGYIVEQRRTGTVQWVRASPLLIPFPELSISGLEPGWRYQFRIFAENAVGLSEPSESSEPLTAAQQKFAVTAPVFTEELHDALALENEKVEFIVHFLGQPPPKICWFKDGFEIFSSRRIRIITDEDKSILTIHQSALSDEGEIKCTATNKAGHASTKARLALEAPPSIRLPRQYEDGLLFEIGEVIRLKVSVAGRPTPLIFWTHNGESIQNNERCEIEYVDKCSILKLGEARRSDRGEYQIKAVNKVGEDIASFLVTVTDKPSPPGRARVIMTLGRSVTLSWSTPEDDGGCKIGNYIIEYYRLGWNVWLKAATSRQLSTVLGDLIEGSEYKFRVKAESPYGVSDPSEESDTIFIPDHKRGITTPEIRSRSQPRDFINDVAAPIAARRKHKPRSQSSTRAELGDTAPVDFYGGGVPKRPERTKIKSPPMTPGASPLTNRKSVGLNTMIGATAAREMAYGSPDIKVKRSELSIPKAVITPSSSERSTSTSPKISPVQSPTSFKTEVIKKPNNLNENFKQMESASPAAPLKNPVTTKTEIPPKVIDKSPSPKPIKANNVQAELRSKRSPSPQPKINTLSTNEKPHREKSPSPYMLDYVTERPQMDQKESPAKNDSENAVKSPTPSQAPHSPATKKRLFRENSANISGSSEFMLVLYPDENERDQDRRNSEIYFDFDDIAIPPPLSLSAPELGVEPPTFGSLKLSASSSELLHERAMMRFNEAVAQEEADLEKRKKNLKSLEIPTIQINDKEIERKDSFRRRLSAGSISQNKMLWVQRRYSLKSPSDLSEIVKIKEEVTLKRDGVIRQRSESEEREEELFEKIREKMALQGQSSFEKKDVQVIDEDKWLEEYEESLSEEETSSSEDERFNEPLQPSKRIYSDEEEEEETYHPGLMARKIVSEEPFEILTKKNKLPDPNFVPKPILKKTHNVDLPQPPSIKNAKVRSRSPIPQSIEQRRRSSSITDAALGFLKRKASLTPKIEEDKQESETENNPEEIVSPGHNISKVAEIGAIAATSVIIHQPFVGKKQADEEAKVVIDHYGDIVRSYGRGRRIAPEIYLDRDKLKSAAGDDDDFEWKEVDYPEEVKKQLERKYKPESKEILKETVKQEIVATKEPLFSDLNRQQERKMSLTKNEQIEPERRPSIMADKQERKPSLPKEEYNERRSSLTVDYLSYQQHRRTSLTSENPEYSQDRRSSISKTGTAQTGRRQSIGKEPQSRSETPFKGRRRSLSRSQKRTPSKSPARSENWDVKPQRKSAFPERRGSFARRSPSPLPPSHPRPMLREIMTQTSNAGLVVLKSEMKNEKLIVEAEKTVRSAVDYISDLAMFLLACWLYLFSNELLAIPVLIIMVYRQLSDAVRKSIPKWILRRFQNPKKK